MRFRSFFFLFIFSSVLIACNESNSSKPSKAAGENTGSTKTAKSDSLLTAINRRIAGDPNNYLNYLDRAKYYGDKREFSLAFEDISRAQRVDSTKADIYLYKGKLLFSQDKIKEAYEEYKVCLLYDALNVDCNLRKAEIDIALRNYDQARGHINEVLKQNEYNAEAYFIRGRMYLTLKDSGLAASSYKTAIEVNPSYYDAYIEVGLLYASQKSDLAREYYNSAIEIKPKSVEAWYNKAIFLQETGVKKKERYREAFACYDTILKMDNRFSAAYFNKGFIYLEYMQKYDSAAVQFTNAIGVYPQYYQAYYNRGLCYESTNKLAEAEADYRSALKLDPDYTEAAISLNRVLKGR